MGCCYLPNTGVKSATNLAMVGCQTGQGFVQSADDVKECRKHCKGKDIKAGWAAQRVDDGASMDLCILCICLFLIIYMYTHT